MLDFAYDALGYRAVLVLHILSVIAWVAGLLIAGRYFVHHAAAVPGDPMARMLEDAEARLFRIILNPSILLVWMTGLGLVTTAGFWAQGWVHAKIALVLGLSGVHGAFARLRKGFRQGGPTPSRGLLKFFNEVPFLILIPIVVLVIFKPF